MKLLLRLPKAIILTIACLSPFIAFLGGMIWLLLTFEEAWGRYFNSTLMVFIVFFGFKFLLSLFITFVAFLMGKEETTFKKIFQVSVIDVFKEIDPKSMIVFAFIGIWMVFTSNQFIYYSDWIKEDLAGLYGILMIYLGIYEGLRISERKTTINKNAGYNEEEQNIPKPTYPLGIHLQSILVMSFWSAWMILLFYLFDQHIPAFPYHEIVFILLVVGLSYAQTQGLRRLENSLFDREVINWNSGYGDGII